jgi:cytochrome P450
MDRDKPIVEFDHHSPEFASDPAARLAELRTTCPVAWSSSHGGFWALTRLEEVSRVLSDPATFSSRHDLEPESPFQGVTIPPPPMRFIPVEMDPPEFVAYRRILNPLFSRAVVDTLRPRMEACADWCLDQVIEGGRIDLVYELASPVPAMVTLELLGLPIADWPRYATAYHDMVAHPPGTPRLEAAFASAGAIATDLAALIAERRADPDRSRRGAIDALLDADLDGTPIPDERLLDVITLVLAGGIDTTTGAAAGALVFLSDHPEHRQRLIDEPELLEPACEELIRWVTPTPVLARTATHSVMLGGREILEHERVMTNLFAANRDPDAFERPDDVVLDRQHNRHVAFGLGIHRCVGANLARAELQTMLSRVLTRIPDFTVVHERVQRYHTAGVQNGYITVPATFTPAARVGVELGTA